MVARKGKFNHLEVYIKQGDPLSPYISILCMEFQGRKLAKQTENRKSHIGIPTHEMDLKSLF